MNNYELMLVLEAALEQEKKDAILETVKEIISVGGEVEKVDVWGNRRLAYPILKKNEGYYAVVNFKANAELPKELDRRLKILDAVIRHMIINVDQK